MPIWDCVHSKFYPFNTKFIQDHVHPQSCLFKIMSTLECVHSRLFLIRIMPIVIVFFGIVSIQAIVHIQKIKEICTLPKTGVVKNTSPKITLINDLKNMYVTEFPLKSIFCKP